MVGTVKGYADEPAEQDLLNCEKYFNGLTDFIRTCPMPMTVAIQGGWGTGKSTAMKAIKKKLDENKEENKNIRTSEYNTWKYSKTDGMSIIGPLLLKLINILDDAGKKNEDYKKSIIKNRISPLALLAGTVCTAGSAALELCNIRDTFVSLANRAAENLKQDENVDSLLGVDILIEELNKRLTHDALKDKRFVFFIDDLDRLRPEDAVNFLEDMKNLMWIDRFVFVLALDNEIIQKGLCRKYGEDIEKKYAERFFDKIIQLPFFLPTDEYDVEKYIHNLNKTTTIFTDEEVTLVAEILEKYEERNPRTIKRLLNTLWLYKSIKDENDNNQSIVDSFRVIYLQLAYQNIYNWILNLERDYQKIDRIDSVIEGKIISDEKNYIDMITMDGFKSYCDGDIENIRVVKSIISDIHDNYKDHPDNLSRSLSNTAVRMEIKSSSLLEELDELVRHLASYAGKIYVGWDSLDGKTFSIKQDSTDYYVQVQNMYNKHVNLKFVVSSPDESKALMGLQKSEQSLVYGDKNELYGLDILQNTDNTRDDSFIIANVKVGESPQNGKVYCGTVILRGVSSDDDDVLRVAGNMMRNFSEGYKIVSN